MLLAVGAVITSAQADFKEAVKSAASASGNPVDVMKKVVEITTDEAVVCLALEGDKVYRLHTNKKYDGEVTDTNEIPLFQAFFQMKDQDQVKYKIMSGGAMRDFIIYKTHIDDTHLCFARVLDKSPPQDSSAAPGKSKKKSVKKTASEDNG